MEEIAQPKSAVRFEIGRSLVGNKIVYFARDSGGAIRLQAENLVTLEKMISEYRLPEPPKSPVDKETVVDEQLDALVETIVEVQEEEAKKSRRKKTQSPDTAEETSEASEEKKEFLKNELKEAIEEQKEKTTKKSFWDRLK